MPITNDRPRHARDLRHLTLNHPIGGRLHYSLERPVGPAAVAEIAGDLEKRGLDWPPPEEFAEASLRRWRNVFRRADGKLSPDESRRDLDAWARLQDKWAAEEPAARAERARRRQERRRLREQRVEACSRPLHGVRSGPPRTVAREAGQVTVRTLQPVGAGGRRLGGPYRLERDEAKRSLRVLDPGGTELSVVRDRGFERADDGGLAWAGRVVERDLWRGPARGVRTYEVEAGVDGGALGNCLGTRQVEARTSAEALRAVPARRFAAGLGPQDRAVLLSAHALDDPDDYSYAVQRVPARERGAGRGQPERAVSFER